MSQMRNDFKPGTHELFADCRYCWACGVNRPDAGHHIVGRGAGDSTLEKSPLNFCPIHNQRCHVGKSFNDVTTGRFLVKTLRYLLNQGYKTTDLDKQFMRKYARLYDIGFQAENLWMEAHRN